MATVTFSAAPMFPPLRVTVNWPLTGPTSLAFAIVAAIVTTAGLSAIVTVALGVPMLYEPLGWIVRTTVSAPSTRLSWTTLTGTVADNWFAGMVTLVPMFA